MIRAGIVGATGYAGVELVRLLARHPGATIAAVSSESFTGQDISEVYPNLAGAVSMTLTDAQGVIEGSDCVFACLPHGLSQDMAAECDAKGKVFIDMGADFRLDSAQDYEQWYAAEYKNAPLHEKAVYGLCELYRDRIKDARIIGNPGCYPTASALALAPLLKGGFALTGHVIIDAKSGVTGAGRSMTQNTHYPECNEAFSAYKIAAHRHTPEIEQTLSGVAGARVGVTFTPHLLPVNRGILATCYATAAPGFELERARAYYADFYRDEKFVRFVKSVDIKRVRCSNYCDVALDYDGRCGTVIVTSVIDNMVKGAAGQAIQNMNIIFGQAEDAGLDYIPPAF